VLRRSTLSRRNFGARRPPSVGPQSFPGPLTEGVRDVAGSFVHVGRASCKPETASAISPEAFHLLVLENDDCLPSAGGVREEAREVGERLSKLLQNVVPILICPVAGVHVRGFHAF
jgi:hypothetical protein